MSELTLLKNTNKIVREQTEENHIFMAECCLQAYQLISETPDQTFFTEEDAQEMLAEFDRADLDWMHEVSDKQAKDDERSESGIAKDFKARMNADREEKTLIHTPEVRDAVKANGKLFFIASIGDGRATLKSTKGEVMDDIPLTSLKADGQNKFTKKNVYTYVG